MLLHTVGQAHTFQHGSGIGQHIGPAGTAYQGRHGHIFQGREFRQEMMELKHEAQRPVAEAGLLSGVIPDMSRPSKKIFPLLGVSRAPIRCKRVLLPEPEVPTMASDSPSSTDRLISLKISRFSGPENRFAHMFEFVELGHDR